MNFSTALDALLTQGEVAVLVHILEAEGSTPREAGAQMLVSTRAMQGTIGGGQLEFHALDVAREMLKNGEMRRELLLHLGPHLGQCCGGRVKLEFWRASAADVVTLRAQETRTWQQRPKIRIFGAGHTGLALCRQLALLPYCVELIDDRAGVLTATPDGIDALQTENPAEFATDNGEAMAMVVLTHSHALDYDITATALRNERAVYVGMIGSATKKARFSRWFLGSGGTKAQIARLTCPIGGADVADKRPEVIAALTIAEVIRALAAN